MKKFIAGALIALSGCFTPNVPPASREEGRFWRVEVWPRFGVNPIIYRAASLREAEFMFNFEQPFHGWNGEEIYVDIERIEGFFPLSEYAEDPDPRGIKARLLRGDIPGASND